MQNNNFYNLNFIEDSNTLEINFEEKIYSSNFVRCFGYLQKILDTQIYKNNTINSFIFNFEKTTFADKVFLVNLCLHIYELNKLNIVSLKVILNYENDGFIYFLNKNGFLDTLKEFVKDMKIVEITKFGGKEDNNSIEIIYPFSILDSIDEIENTINFITTIIKDSYSKTTLNNVKVFIDEIIENSFEHGYPKKQKAKPVGVLISEIKSTSQQFDNNIYTHKDFYNEKVDSIEIIIADIGCGIGVIEDDLDKYDDIRTALDEIDFDSNLSRKCKNLVDFIFSDGLRGKNKISSEKKSKTGGINLICHTFQQTNSYLSVLTGYYCGVYNCNRGYRKNNGVTRFIGDEQNIPKEDEFIHGTSFISNILLNKSSHESKFNSFKAKELEVENFTLKNDISAFVRGVSLDCRFNSPYYHSEITGLIYNEVLEIIGDNSIRNKYLIHCFIDEVYSKINIKIIGILKSYLIDILDTNFEKIYLESIQKFYSVSKSEIFKLLEDQLNLVKDIFQKFWCNLLEDNIYFLPKLYMSKNEILKNIIYLSYSGAKTLYIFDIPKIEAIKYLNIFEESKQYEDINDIILVTDDLKIIKLSYLNQVYSINDSKIEITRQDLFNILKVFDSKKFWYMLNTYELDMEMNMLFNYKINWENTHITGYLNFISLTDCKEIFKLFKLVLKRLQNFMKKKYIFKFAEPFTEILCDQLNYECQEENEDIYNNVDTEYDILHVGSVYVTGETSKDMKFDGSKNLVYFFDRNDSEPEIISLLNFVELSLYIDIVKNTDSDNEWKRLGKLPYITKNIDKKVFLNSNKNTLSTEDFYKLISIDNNILEIGHFCNNTLHDFFDIDFYTLFKLSYRNSARKINKYDDIFEFIFLVIARNFLTSNDKKFIANNSILNEKVNKLLISENIENNNKILLVYTNEFYAHKIISKLRMELIESVNKDIIYLPISTISNGESMFISPQSKSEIEKRVIQNKNTTVMMFSTFTNNGYFEKELENFFLGIGAEDFKIFSLVDRRVLKNKDLKNMFYTKLDIPVLGDEKYCSFCSKLELLASFKNKLILQSDLIERVKQIEDIWSVKKIGSYNVKNIEEYSYIDREIIVKITNNFVDFEFPNKCSYSIFAVFIIEYIKKTSCIDLLDSILESDLIEIDFKMFILSLVINLFSKNELSKTKKFEYINNLFRMLSKLNKNTKNQFSGLASLTILGEEELFLNKLIDNLNELKENNKNIVDIKLDDVSTDFEILCTYLVEKYYYTDCYKLMQFKKYLIKHYYNKLNLIEIIYEYLMVNNDSRHCTLIRKLYNEAIDFKKDIDFCNDLNRHLNIIKKTFENIQDEFHITCNEIINKIADLNIVENDIDEIKNSIINIVDFYKENLEHQLYCSVESNNFEKQLNNIINTAIKDCKIEEGQIEFNNEDIKITFVNSEKNQSHRCVYFDKMIVDEIVFLIRDFRHANSDCKITYQNREYIGVIKVNCCEDGLELCLMNKISEISDLDEIRKNKNNQFRVSFNHFKDVLKSDKLQNNNRIDVEETKFNDQNVLCISFKLPYLG